MSSVLAMYPRQNTHAEQPPGQDWTTYLHGWGGDTVRREVVVLLVVVAIVCAVLQEQCIPRYSIHRPAHASVHHQQRVQCPDVLRGQ